MVGGMPKMKGSSKTSRPSLVLLLVQVVAASLVDDDLTFDMILLLLWALLQ